MTTVYVEMIFVHDFIILIEILTYFEYHVFI